MLLSVVHDYAVLPAGDRRRFEARTTYYAYEILEHGGREIVAFHWHEQGKSRVVAPHLHISSRMPTIDLGPRFDPVVLAEMHLPTGLVRLADVVRLLIEEFGVAPRRADWEAVLHADGEE